MDVSRAGVWLSRRDFTSLRPWVTTSAKAVPRNKRLASNHYKVNEEKEPPQDEGVPQPWNAFLAPQGLVSLPIPALQKNNIKIKINHIWPVVTVKKE